MSQYWSLAFILPILAIATPTTNGRAAEPSFKCVGSLSGVERLICGSDTLSSADLTLAATYKRIFELPDTLPIDKGKIQREEREWLRSRAGVCMIPQQTIPADEPGRFTAIICLSDLYRNRTNDLWTAIEEADRQARQIPAPPPAPDHITDPPSLRDIAEDFRTQGLDRLLPQGHAKIESCDGAIGYIVEGPGHDSSFAAHCRIRVEQTSIDVIMCDDEMVGKFAIRPSSINPPREDVVNFVKAACPPGG